MKLAAILLSAIALLAQNASTEKFAGTWEARFDGTVFCVLKIQSAGKLTGSMTGVDIGVDNDGNLNSAQAEDQEFPILKPAIENDTLTFEWTDDPNEPPLKFEMKLTGNQQAQLRFVTTPDNVKIKPFTFTRHD
jgi:hypothetical protein